MPSLARTLALASIITGAIAVVSVPTLLSQPSVSHATDRASLQPGMQVVVWLAHSPSPSSHVQDVTGTILEMNDRGVLLETKERSVIQSGRRSANDFPGVIMVPWSSVLFIKL